MFEGTICGGSTVGHSCATNDWSFASSRPKPIAHSVSWWMRRSPWAFRGPLGSDAKLVFASILAAALARIALVGGGSREPVVYRGRGKRDPVPRSAGGDQFDRLVASLEAVRPGGDAYADPEMLSRALDLLASTTRRGAVVIVLSDLLDALPGAANPWRPWPRVGARCRLSRFSIGPKSISPIVEPYACAQSRGCPRSETDVDAARTEYVNRLRELTHLWERAVVVRGGRFLRATTSEIP